MIKVQSKLSHKQGADDLFNKQTMDLNIYKDKRNSGKHYHKVPANTLSSYTKAYACKDITKYIEMYDDLGCMNYIAIEYNIITKLDPYTTYVYEDLY